MTIIASIIGLLATSIVVRAICDTDWFQKKWKGTFSHEKRTKIKFWTNIILIATLTILVVIGISCRILNWGAMAIPLLFGVLYLIGMGMFFCKARKDAGPNTIQEMASNEKPTDEITSNEKPIDEIAKESLISIGCNPILNNDGTLSVSYQGESFIIEFPGVRYARIWNPMWSEIKVDNPELPKVQEAVNSANFHFGPTVVLTAPNDEGVVGIHSRIDIMLHPACPDNVPFINSILDSFSDTKETVRNIFYQLQLQEMDTQKKRRPVGFTANHSTINDAD